MEIKEKDSGEKRAEVANATSDLMVANTEKMRLGIPRSSTVHVRKSMIPKRGRMRLSIWRTPSEYSKAYRMRKKMQLAAEKEREIEDQNEFQDETESVQISKTPAEQSLEHKLQSKPVGEESINDSTVKRVKKSAAQRQREYRERKQQQLLATAKVMLENDSSLLSNAIINLDNTLRLSMPSNFNYQCNTSNMNANANGNHMRTAEEISETSVGQIWNYREQLNGLRMAAAAVLGIGNFNTQGNSVSTPKSFELPDRQSNFPKTNADTSQNGHDKIKLKRRVRKSAKISQNNTEKLNLIQIATNTPTKKTEITTTPKTVNENRESETRRVIVKQENESSNEQEIENEYSNQQILYENVQYLYKVMDDSIDIKDEKIQIHQEHKKNVDSSKSRKKVTFAQANTYSKSGSSSDTDTADEGPQWNEIDDFEKVPEIHKCDMCNRIFNSLSNLKSHYIVHGEKKFTCTVCQKQFFRKDSLTKHQLWSRHGAQNNVKSSSTKSKSFPPDDNNLGNQTNVQKTNETSESSKGKKTKRTPKSSKDEQDEYEVKIFQCPYCDKILSRKHILKRHISIYHIQEGPVTCDICQKIFRDKFELGLHLKNHDRDKPPNYLCHICSKGYSHVTSFNYHMSTHSGVKSHVCEICDTGFTTIISLKNHKRLHTGEKPFICDICKEGFVTKEIVKRHLKRKHMQDIKSP